MTTLRDALTEALRGSIEDPVPEFFAVDPEVTVDTLLVHPAMQAIEAKVALAEAVEGLPNGWHLTNWGYRWEVREPQPVSVSRGSAITALDALRAAKGERS